MNVGYQLPEIPIFFAENGFVAVLKKMSVPPMPVVEAHRITGQQPAHDRCDRLTAGAQQEVGVVAHQRPRVTGGLRLREMARQPFEKILAVFIIFKNRCTVYPSNDDVMQGPRGIDASLTRHG